MPPKRSAGNRVPVLVQDWSWIGTEVTTADEITAAHRRRAAGLGHDSLKACPLDYADRLTTCNADGRGSHNSDIKFIGGLSCTAKKCKTNPVCYNHLGLKAVLDEGAKAAYLEEKLGDVPEERKGPAGLRNLGATCYANAYIQLWYHDIAFRNGVYACATKEGTPLYHLALVFASLQNTRKKIVDPMSLIEVLGLEKGNQQDAAEFSKLFLHLIDSEFRKHPDPKLQTLTRDLFEGKVEYTITCNTCNYRSVRDNPFLELEVNLKENCNLQAQLTASLAPEELTDDNQYACPQCGILRTAVRRTSLSRLPPVLHFALMRFVYSAKTQNRKKVKASITYPRVISLGGNSYDLRGIITHLGQSAHHGHFVCRAFDETLGEWFTCNDEEVIVKEEPPNKKIRLHKEDDKESSRDAYMLVYKKRGKVIPEEPPKAILERVQAENDAFAVELDEVARKRERLIDEYDQILGAKKDVINVLPGIDHLVLRDSLEKWMKASTVDELYSAWETPTCSHGGIDPRSAGNFQLISASALDKLLSYAQVPEIDICIICVEEEFHRQVEGASLGNQRQRFDELNVGGGYFLPKKWLDEWRKGTLPPGTLPNDEEYTLYCEHDLPWRGAEVSVSPKAVDFLRSIVGHFDAYREDEPKCPQCTDARSAEQEAAKVKKKETALDRRLAADYLDTKSLMFNTQYFYLPQRFVEEWKDYRAGNGGVPNLSMDLCEHELLDVDLKRDKFHHITAEGWKILDQKYGPVDPVRFTFDPSGSVNWVGVDLCVSCRRKKLLDFTKATIRLQIMSKDAKQNDQGDIQPVVGQRRSRRVSNGKFVEYEVEKSTSMKDMKVMVYQDYGISPICQRLFFDDREVEADETIESLEVLVGDTIRCVTVEEEGDIEDVVPVAEGFDGTALLDRIACKDCSFDNEPGASMCEMCYRPFGYDI